MSEHVSTLGHSATKHIPMVAAGVIFGIVGIVIAFFALQWAANDATQSYEQLNDNVAQYEDLRRTLSEVHIAESQLFGQSAIEKAAKERVQYIDGVLASVEQDIAKLSMSASAKQQLSSHIGDFASAYNQLKDLTKDVGIGNQSGYKQSLNASGNVLERYAQSRKNNTIEIDVLRMRAHEQNAGNGVSGDAVDEVERLYQRLQAELTRTGNTELVTTLRSYLRTYLALARTDEVLALQRAAMGTSIDAAVVQLDKSINELQQETSVARDSLAQRQQLIGFTFMAVIFAVLVATIYAFSTLMRQTKLGQDAIERQHEQLVDAKRHAEEALKSRSAFLATISHEIRTPMNGVLGMAQLLKRTQLDPDQHERLDRLMRSGKTMMGLLNDLLDLSKIEAGKLDLEPVPINIREMLFDLESIFGAVANEKDISLNLVIDERLPAVVTGDEVRVRQIITNLLSNAIKFTTEGVVTLSASDNENFKVPKNHLALSIVVQDSGIGMTQEALKGIFDPFSQAEQSTTRKFGGTGLGLAILKELITLMKGDVEVFSEVGSGSTFVVILPMPIASAQATANSDAKEEVLVAHNNSLNILVAEDNNTNAQLITWMLEDWGHTVTVAENGLLALEAHQEHTYDLILMDHHMPEMDGLEATKRIRAMDGVKGSIPVVGCTADAYADNKAALMDAGQNDIVTKPIEEKQLHLVLLKCIKGEFARSA